MMKKLILLIMLVIPSMLFAETWTYKVLWRPNGVDATFIEYTRNTGEKYLAVLPWYLKHKENQELFAEKTLPDVIKKYQRKIDKLDWAWITF